MRLREGRISRVVFRFSLDQRLHELGVGFLVLGRSDFLAWDS